MMKRLLCLLAGLFLLATATSQGEAAVQPKQPNILFFFADDLRADTVGAFGGKDVHTPNIDASGGTRHQVYADLLHGVTARGCLRTRRAQC